MDVAEDLENLERVFPPRPIDPADAFAEWGGTYVDADAFRDGVRGMRWTDLDGAFLERHHDALVFFGPASISKYLPAYLRALVRRDPALDALPTFLLSVLTPDGDEGRFEARFERLTAARRRAIARVLAAHEIELAGSSRQAEVRAALDGYWRAQLGGAG